MGVGMRLTKEYGDRLTRGILATMTKMGMLPDYKGTIHQPLISHDGNVGYINANQSGIFMPEAKHGQYLKKGQLVGVIADPLTGEVREELLSPNAGLLFTLREYPVTLSGSLIARVLEV